MLYRAQQLQTNNDFGKLRTEILNYITLHFLKYISVCVHFCTIYWFQIEMERLRLLSLYV